LSPGDIADPSVTYIKHTDQRIRGVSLTARRHHHGAWCVLPPCGALEEDCEPGAAVVREKTTGDGSPGIDAPFQRTHQHSRSMKTQHEHTQLAPGALLSIARLGV